MTFETQTKWVFFFVCFFYKFQTFWAQKCLRFSRKILKWISKFEFGFFLLQFSDFWISETSKILSKIFLRFSKFELLLEFSLPFFSAYSGNSTNLTLISGFLLLFSEFRFYFSDIKSQNSGIKIRIIYFCVSCFVDCILASTIYFGQNNPDIKPLVSFE